MRPIQIAALLLTATFVALPASARAQEASAGGTVTDSSGAVLPGVTITATHVASGNVFTVVSDADGTYRFAALRVGIYRFTGELPGFSTVRRDALELLVGQRLVVDLKMELSAVQEQVTVTGAAPLVDTTQSKLGGNIDPRQLESLPVNGRNWLDLAMLAPGARGNSVTEAPLPRDNGAFQLNLDGQQVTSIISASSFGNPRFSRDAIGEFQFVANRFDATQGRSMGVQVNAVTKSGTNKFGGTFAGYFRDDSFNAKDFVVDRVLPYSNTQISTTFGGPIRRDRTHFFVYHEWETEPGSYTFTSAYPAFNLADFTGDRRERKSGVRLDTQFDTRKRLTVRGNLWRNQFPYDPRVTGGSTQHPSTASHTDRWSDQLFASFSQVIGNNAVNEIKAGYTSFLFISDGYVKDSVRINLRGYSIGKPSNYFQKFGQATWSLRDDFSFHFDKGGRHDLKTGGEYLNNLIYSYWPNAGSGILTVDRGPVPANIESLFPVWNDTATWNLAALSPLTSRYSQAFGNFQLYMPEDMFGFWVQDDWRLSDRLTLNLGLRYDVSFGAFVEDVEVLPFMPGGRPSDTNNIGPRLGFAYSLQGGKTVLRGGAGKFFAAITNNQAHSTTLSAQRALAEVENDGRPDFAANPWNGRPPTVEEAFRIPQALNVIDPEAETPFAYQASIGFQRQIGETMAVEADYVYTASRSDFMVTNMNLRFDPATGFNLPYSNIATRPYPQFGRVLMWHTWGYSNYHGLQTAWTKRFSNQWQASATYTLSQLKDTGAPYSSQPDNHFDRSLKSEYAPAAGDQRHRLVFNGIWELPYDLQLSGLYFFGSGEVFQTSVGSDRRDTGGGSRLRADGSIMPRTNFTGEPVHRVDVRATKRIRVFRSLTVDGSLEVFNLFNHANYGSYVTVESSALYGQPQQNANLAFQPRMLQLGFRVGF